MEETGMTSLDAFGWCFLGIVISVALPGLWAYVRERFPTAPGSPRKGLVNPSELFTLIRPYLALGAASTMTAILVMAFVGDSLVDYRAALLAGYAWDSTLQKLK